MEMPELLISTGALDGLKRPLYFVGMLEEKPGGLSHENVKIS